MSDPRLVPNMGIIGRIYLAIGAGCVELRGGEHPRADQDEDAAITKLT
jgi:hypothetical protein